jgi:hypothetical protein
MTEEEKLGLEHAWRYFALHAEQRMTVFNFYVASAGLALTGLAWTLAEGSGKWPLGAAAGIGAAALSFVFWRLDQRGVQLVKNAEDAMVAIEAMLPGDAAVTTAERRLPNNAGWAALLTPWTFGRSFRLLFATVALFGAVGAGVTTWLGTSATKPPISHAREAAGQLPTSGRSTPSVVAAPAIASSPVPHPPSVGDRRSTEPVPGAARTGPQAGRSSVHR